jgi:hypothetical protein
LPNTIATSAGAAASAPVRRSARSELLERHATTPRRAPQHKLAVGYRTDEIRHDDRLAQHIVRACRESRRFMVGKLMRLHEHEPRESHRAYRPRRRADIARMRGAHEDET